MKPRFFMLVVAVSVGAIFLVTGCSGRDSEETLSVSVAAAALFESDVLPVINDSCKPCHTRGTGTENLTVYDTAKKKIEKIIDRINREEDSTGFMPVGGKKLTDYELLLFASWRDGGLAGHI